MKPLQRRLAVHDGRRVDGLRRAGASAVDRRPQGIFRAGVHAAPLKTHAARRCRRAAHVRVAARLLLEQVGHRLQHRRQVEDRSRTRNASDTFEMTFGNLRSSGPSSANRHVICRERSATLTDVARSNTEFLHSSYTRRARCLTFVQRRWTIMRFISSGARTCPLPAARGRE